MSWAVCRRLIDIPIAWPVQLGPVRVFVLQGRFDRRQRGGIEAAKEKPRIIIGRVAT